MPPCDINQLVTLARLHCGIFCAKKCNFVNQIAAITGAPAKLAVRDGEALLERVDKVSALKGAELERAVTAFRWVCVGVGVGMWVCVWVRGRGCVLKRVRSQSCLDLYPCQGMCPNTYFVHPSFEILSNNVRELLPLTALPLFISRILLSLSSKSFPAFT